MTAPLVEQIVTQMHQLLEDSLIRPAQKEVRAERAKNLEKRAERLNDVAPQKTRRALDLATEKGSSMWLTKRIPNLVPMTLSGKGPGNEIVSLPLKEMGFSLNKREFRDKLSLHYD